MTKIAVVEDNPDNRLLVRVILEPLYQVLEYESGPSALDAFVMDKPDLVLLDISLPEMDGVEVLRRIRAHPNIRDLPVIALTAHAMAGDREKYLGLGFNDYVTKPIVDESVLLDAIQTKVTSAQTSAEPRFENSEALPSNALERLRKLGGDAFVAEMIGIFLEYTELKISQGRKAFDNGDLPALQNAMHPIKSSAGNVGASEIQDLASRIEALAKNGQAGSLESLLKELETVFASARVQFEQTRQTLLTK